jgi:hypothetical protein
MVGVAFSLGLLGYLLPAAVAPLFGVEVQRSIGQHYYKQGARSFRQFAFVRRALSGVELKPISVQADRRLAEVTLSSAMVGENHTLPFEDPAGRIGRLYNKPVAIVCEALPAATDPELAELGHWTHHKEMADGLDDGEIVDPHIGVSNEVRVSDPMDTLYLAGKSIEPENVKTAFELTRKRFEQYGSQLGMAETLGTLTGFAMGLGGVAGIRYLQNQVLDGAGGGGGVTAPPVPLHALSDAVVMVL